MNEWKIGDYPQLCACLGPMYDEPHCPCKMERLGLPLNVEAREAQKLKNEAKYGTMEEVFAKIFKWKKEPENA